MTLIALLPLIALQVLEGAAAQVLSSASLRACLGLILRLGNVLNRGTPRGHAAGFDVSVLPTLAAVKSSTDTSISLLHYVAAVMCDPSRETDGEGAAAIPSALKVEAVKPAKVEVATPAKVEAAAERLAGTGGTFDVALDAAADVEMERAALSSLAEIDPATNVCDADADGTISQEPGSSGSSPTSVVPKAEPKEPKEGEAEAEAEAKAKAKKVDLVLELRNELGEMPSVNEATDLLASVEGQINNLTAELTKVRTELALLPHPPAPPAMCPGYPFMQPIADDKLMVLFATEEAATVCWMLQPHWKKAPSFSNWGKPMPPPRFSDVVAGRCRTGAPAIASGTVVLRAADESRLVLLEHLPRGAEVHLFAVVVDSFGWSSGLDDGGSGGGGGGGGGGSISEDEDGSEEGSAPPHVTPWQRMAIERMRCGSEAAPSWAPGSEAARVTAGVGADGRTVGGGTGAEMGTGAGSKENALADDSSALADDADAGAADGSGADGADGAPDGASTAAESSSTSALGRADSRAVCASHPPMTTLGMVPPLPPDDATADQLRSHAECRAVLRVLSHRALRAQLLVNVRSTRSKCGAQAEAKSGGGRVIAMATRMGISVNDVLTSGSLHSPIQSPHRTARLLGALSSPLLSSPLRSSPLFSPPFRGALPGGLASFRGSLLRGDASPSPNASPFADTPPRRCTITDAEDEPQPLKAPVEGLYTRFLLTSFLTVAGAELAELRRRRDALLQTLSQCAGYLGLGRAAHSNVGDQLGALSVLRDFALALAKCAAENEARELEAARLERLEKQRQLEETSRLARLQLREEMADHLENSSGNANAGVPAGVNAGLPGVAMARGCSAPEPQTPALPPMAKSAALVEASPARAYDEQEYF